MTAIEKTHYYSYCQEEGTRPDIGGDGEVHTGKLWGPSCGRGEGGIVGKSFYCGFSRKEQAEQGKDMLL